MDVQQMSSIGVQRKGKPWILESKEEELVLEAKNRNEKDRASLQLPRNKWHSTVSISVPIAFKLFTPQNEVAAGLDYFIP